MNRTVLHRNDGAGGDLTKRDYWRDNRDRIVAWEKGFNLNVNPRENGRGDRYQYDDAGQLTQAAYQAENAHDTAGTAERTDAFHYDEMGNRTGGIWVASRGLMKYGGRNNKLNQYGSWENNIPWPDPLHWGLDLWYDDAAPHPAAAPWLPPGNGVLMGDGWNVAAFNALNQPVQMTSFSYEGTGNWMWFGYDPLGRCVKRWVGPGDGSAPNGATYLYYDGWSLVQEGLSANSVARTYIPSHACQSPAPRSVTSAVCTSRAAKDKVSARITWPAGHSLGLLTDDELSRFSPEAQEQITFRL